MTKQIWEEPRKEETINMFSKYFDLEELQHIVDSVETKDHIFTVMMEESLKRKQRQSLCLNCRKTVHLEAPGTIIINGKISRKTDKNTLSPFCDQACLKQWISKKL